VCPAVNRSLEQKIFFAGCFFLAMKFEKDYEKRSRILLGVLDSFSAGCKKISTTVLAEIFFQREVYVDDPRWQCGDSR
jgi:hypothetical protein